MKKFLVTQTVTYYVHAHEEGQAQDLADFDADEIKASLPGSSRPALDTKVEEV